MDIDEDKARKRITDKDKKDEKDMLKRRKQPGAQSGVQIPKDPEKLKVPTQQIPPGKKPKK